MKLLVAITPGLEGALLDELSEIGLAAREVEGGALVEGTIEDLYVVNLWSRLAARVSVTLAETHAKNLDQLASVVRGLDWRKYVWPGQPLDVHATLRQSRIKHRDSAKAKVERAITDALRGPRLPGPRPPRTPARVNLRVVNDTATISVDSSGELLHRRGWRQSTAKAPLRENLAAAVLHLAEWVPGMPLADPMCGSGTFAIEAATIALGRAPGSGREFAFQRWPSFAPKVWAPLERQARRTIAFDVVAPITASDHDSGAVKATTDNAARANVRKRLVVSQAALRDVEPPAPSGLVVMNPPYGVRVGAKAGRVYHQIGGDLRARWSGWKVALLLPDRKFKGALGIELEELATFSNGGIRVHLYAGKVP